MKPDSWAGKFNRFLASKSLRHSRPREEVARAFFECESHVGVEELCRIVRRQSPEIGIATVYRTLGLLVEGGLAVRRDFDSGATSYERSADEHHDHLLCTGCGKIVEFRRDEIERLQNEVAKSHGYTLTFHKMELYGLCRVCRTKSTGNTGRRHK